MPTERVYFPSTGLPSVSPPFESWWTKTSDSVRLMASAGERLSTPFSTLSSSNTYMPAWEGSAIYARVLLVQYVTYPIGAGTSHAILLGTNMGTMRARGTFTGGASSPVRGPKVHVAYACKYVSGDGMVTRGVHAYLNVYPGTNPHAWVDAITVYNFAASSYTHGDYVVQDGDRLVLEIGY